MSTLHFNERIQGYLYLVYFWYLFISIAMYKKKKKKKTIDNKMIAKDQDHNKNLKKIKVRFFKQ